MRIGIPLERCERFFSLVSQDTFMDFSVQGFEATFCSTFPTLFSIGVDAFFVDTLGNRHSSSDVRVCFFRKSSFIPCFLTSDLRRFSTIAREKLVAVIKKTRGNNKKFYKENLLNFINLIASKQGVEIIHSLRTAFSYRTHFFYLDFCQNNGFYVGEGDLLTHLSKNKFFLLFEEFVEKVDFKNESVFSIFSKLIRLLQSCFVVSFSFYNKKKPLFIDTANRKMLLATNSSVEKPYPPSFSLITSLYGCLSGESEVLYPELGNFILKIACAFNPASPFLKDLTFQDMPFLPLTVEQVEENNIRCIQDLTKLILPNCHYNLNRLPYYLALAFSLEANKIREKDRDKLFCFALSLAYSKDFFYESYIDPISFRHPITKNVETLHFGFIDLVGTYFWSVCISSIMENSDERLASTIKGDKLHIIRSFATYRENAQKLKEPIQIHFASIRAFKDKEKEYSDRVQELEKNLVSEECFIDKRFVNITASDMELIVNEKRLFKEGEIQSHCVHSYLELIQKGECLIYSYLRNNERWTIEITPSYNEGILECLFMVQIRGKSNKKADILTIESAYSRLCELYRSEGVLVEKDIFLYN